MDEKITEKALEYLERLESGVETAADFAVEQAPLVIQEMIRWEIACGAGLAAASLIGIIVTFLVCHLVCRNLKKRDDALAKDAAVKTVALSIIASLILAGLMACGLVRASKAWIAPRIVVLEKLSSLR